MSRNGTLKQKLNNGLTVIAREMHHAPVVSFWLYYRVGSRNELPGITGISHWVEHLMFKGTERFPQGQFDRLISREGGQWNGMTWVDWTTYFETLPSHRLDLALEVEADRMVNSVFEPEGVESERTVIISEREGHENSYRWLLNEEVRAAAFQAHPYHHSVIGWKTDLETITREQLWEHYRTYYAPNNAVAVVIGDIAADEALAKVDAAFGAIPPGPEMPEVRIREPEQRAERRILLEGADPTAHLQVVFPAPSATHPDFFPLVVLDSVLGGADSMNLWGGRSQHRSSRLYKALVETELAAAAGCSFTPTVDPYLVTFGVTIRHGKTLEEAESALWAEIETARNEPPTQAELAKAIKQTRAQFAYGAESVTNQGFWLGFSEMVADIDWFDNWLNRLEQVTAEDVQRVAQTYLRRDRRTVGWYRPRTEANGAPGA